MRETVTLAAEAGDREVKAADTAFNAFIVAANILNQLNVTIGGAVEQAAAHAAIPDARKSSESPRGRGACARSFSAARNGGASRSAESHVHRRALRIRRTGRASLARGASSRHLR
jgi:hypothetical protein